ncbi:AGE family epimerase/isomerase [Paraflavitalea speifideaquila]|uniref:AGE family epimerase/isomerase n=1 Tax=Paraflavitalea speifideaquila TaxID=3076558 RepID=UPI0028E6A51C|nr:AGE family epimerase/isomerase [Paraflavitalea speifideiaquila]
MITRDECEKELNDILDFWAHTAYNETSGTFYGRITNNNQQDATAPLGVVLYARLLWTFSSAYLHTSNPLHKQRADAAYTLLHRHFYDKEHEGFYWSVTATGEPLDTQKRYMRLLSCCMGYALIIQLPRTVRYWRKPDHYSI